MYSWYLLSGTATVCSLRIIVSVTSDKVINLQIPLLATSTHIFGAHTLGPRGSMNLLRNWNKAVEWRKIIIALLHWTPVVR